MAAKYTRRDDAGSFGVVSKDLEIQRLTGRYIYADGRGGAAYALNQKLEPPQNKHAGSNPPKK